MWVEVGGALRCASGREGCVSRLAGQSERSARSGCDWAIDGCVKRNRSIDRVPEVGGKNLYIEHSETYADGGFGIAEGIPGEADAGLKIFQRGIAEQRRDASATRLSHAAIGQGIREVMEAGELAGCLRRYGCHLI